MEKNRTLLIVDDQPEVLKLYAEFLTPSETDFRRKSSRRLYGTGPSDRAPLDKYNVFLAHSGEEAIKILEHELKHGRRVAGGFFDLKLGDGMDGLATIHTVMAMDKDLQGVIVTAYQIPSLEEMSQIISEDFRDQWDCMHKPFTQAEIIQKARQMVSAWNLKQEALNLSKELEETERLHVLEHFSRGVGHELANELLKVMARADLALNEKDPDRLKKQLEAVQQGAEKSGESVRSLQALCHLNSQSKTTTVSACIDAALRLLVMDCSRNAIEIRKVYGDELPCSLAQGLFVQIFAMVLLNLVNALAPGGFIEIKVESSTEQGHEKTSMIVRMHAPAARIPEEVMNRFFDSGFHLQGERVGQLWVGLSWVKNTVAIQGGKFLLTTDESHGVEVVFWIPSVKVGVG